MKIRKKTIVTAGILLLGICSSLYIMYHLSSENTAAASDVYDSKTEYYEDIADQEEAWLWTQQFSNGAFAFYNQENGEVYVNPYFAEEVAIALLEHDSSESTLSGIKKYMDWHFSHFINVIFAIIGIGRRWTTLRKEPLNITWESMRY